MSKTILFAEFKFAYSAKDLISSIFLSSCKSKIFLSIELIFYSFLKLNMLLMYMKFCNHINKTLEII